MNKFVLKSKLAIMANKIDRINGQKVVSRGIDALKDTVKFLKMYAEIVEAMSKFYQQLSDNGKLRSAFIMVIKRGKIVLRDVILHMKDDEEIIKSLAIIGEELKAENSCLEIKCKKICNEFINEEGEE